MNSRNDDPRKVDGETSTSEVHENKIAKAILVTVIGIVSVLYLMNPTAGIIEIIPDNFPMIGNLDELGAATILISCLAYFGIDVRFLLKNKAPKK